MNKKINVLEVSNSLGPGGTEKTMQIFCKYLSKKRFNVYACGFFEGGARERFVRKEVKNLLLAKGNVEKLLNFIKENNTDILHWHSFSGKKDKEKYLKTLEILNFCKENNIKIIETSPFCSFDSEIEKLIDLKLFVSKTLLLKFFWKYGDKVENKSKYYYLYNSLDIEELKKYKLSENEVIEFRKKYGINKDDFVIGKAGRADAWKWSDEIINVVPYLIKEIPNLKVVIRSIPQNKIYKIKNKKLDKYFILLDETLNSRDLYTTYQVMDVLVHTSRIGETFGVSLAEAMYFGKPVITNSTDFTQVTLFDRDNAQVEIVENGVNGFIETDIKKMAEKIILLKTDKKLYEKISKNNANKAIKDFSAKRLTKILEGYFLNKKIVNKNFWTLSGYEKNVIKDDIFTLFNINLNALKDYFKLSL